MFILTPTGLRNRFTEFYIDELDSQEDLRIVVAEYLAHIPSKGATKVDDIVTFYLEAREQAKSNLADGANHKPHYSLRTLCRSLEYTQLTCGEYGFQRALYEGISMSFLTQLNAVSAALMEKLIIKHILKGVNPKSIVQPPKKPTNIKTELFENFWLEVGDLEPQEQPQYILTGREPLVVLTST